MFKLPRKLIFIAAAMLVTPLAFGQLFSFQSDATTSGAKNGNPTAALSASDFKASVTKKSQQAQQELFAQTQSNLKTQSSQMPLPNSPPKPPRNNALQPQVAPTPAPQNNATTDTTTSSSDETALPAAPVTTPPPAANPRAIVMPPETAPAPAPAQPQNQPYTGFGAGSSTGSGNQGSSTPSPSGSGWSIKY